MRFSNSGADIFIHNVFPVSWVPLKILGRHGSKVRAKVWKSGRNNRATSTQSCGLREQQGFLKRRCQASEDPGTALCPHCCFSPCPVVTRPSLPVTRDAACQSPTQTAELKEPRGTAPHILLPICLEASPTETAEGAERPATALGPTGNRTGIQMSK